MFESASAPPPVIPAAQPAPQGYTAVITQRPSGDASYLTLFGWHAPIPVIAVVVAGIFALVNGWVGESLKRLWVRGDRIRLLRSEYLHIRQHYAVTLRLWGKASLGRVRLRQGLYDEVGFLSEDVAGLACLYPELLHRALLLKGTIHNTNAMIEALASKLRTDTQSLSGADRDAITKRMTADMRRTGEAYAALPPEWPPISVWHRGQLLARLMKNLWSRRPMPR